MAPRGPPAAKSLYRALLRAHSRYLSHEMKELGDSYVKAEFRLHRKVTKPEQLDQFFEEWERYLDHILSTARAKQSIATGSLDDKPSGGSFSFGKDLPIDVELSDEQKDQIQKLKETATKPGKYT